MRVNLDTGPVLDCPAFILGNSPFLPTDDLPVLAEKFTIGVNRIAEVFAPTVLLWVDGIVYAETAERMDGCGALTVCDISVRRRPSHLGLHTWVGGEAHRRRSEVHKLCCDGNTGCCAARWAIALGCWPVWLAGMDSAYRDGKTDFWGHNRHHHRDGPNPTLVVMRRETDRLFADFGDTVRHIRDGEHLREVAAACDEVDQQSLKDRIRLALIARGVEVHGES